MGTVIFAQFFFINYNCSKKQTINFLKNEKINWFDSFTVSNLLHSNLIRLIRASKPLMTPLYLQNRLWAPKHTIKRLGNLVSSIPASLRLPPVPALLLVYFHAFPLLFLPRSQNIFSPKRSLSPVCLANVYPFF